MKHYLLLSTASIIFFGSLLVSCRATFVSGPPGSTAQTSQQVVTVREQPKVVVINQAVREQEARATTVPPAATAKQWAPLVISLSSADAVKQYTDGRKYIKKDGYFYWKGYDNRWYMEENDLRKVTYTDEEYIDWTTRGKKQNNSIARINTDKNTANEPGNSAFGHSRGNRDKEEKLVKEKNPNHANGLTKEKDRIEKEIKSKKDREEKLAKEKEEKDRIEKEAKDKKDREEKIAKEKEEKDRIEKEAKDKKDQEEKPAKEKRESQPPKGILKKDQGNSRKIE